MYKAPLIVSDLSLFSASLGSSIMKFSIFCKTLILMLVILASAGLQSSAQEPSLPEGLQKETRQKTEKKEEPELPSGLGDQKQNGQEQPSLPSGLGDPKQKEPENPALPSGLDEKHQWKEPKEKKTDIKAQKEWKLPMELDGFWELRAGTRINDDPVHDDISLAETRFQLSYDRMITEYLARGQLQITSDFIYDAVENDHDDIDLEKGEGFIDLREFWISFTPVEFMDIKAGRQILTWGTGNLIFLNDLFPKDYQSFFLGRDLEYLKAPSDAVKASFYSDIINVDFVYTPRFDADRFVDGTRLSFFDPALGRLRGEDKPLKTSRPDDWFEDDELAVRIYRNIDAYELAVYAYQGFWKGPSGTDPVTGRRTFPELSAYGASLRGPAGPGIGNAEFSWYNSEEDEDGDDPLVKNSEFRFLLGYDQEIATDFTMGMQYYLEYMLDHEEYEKNLPPGFSSRDESLHWVTIDLRYELLAQNQLVLSLFTFYSLSEQDVCFRPKITYDYTDNWRFQIGANLFLGDREAFFGQFEENSNLYSALRYSF